MSDTDELDPEVWSNVTSGGERLTWKQLAGSRAEELARVRPLAQILFDLDRCEHGRHEDDWCSGCDRDHGSAVSVGSPWQYNATWPGKRGGAVAMRGQIGYTIDGSPIVIPPRVDKADPGAWKPSGR